jgi:DNA polymerase-3 subunit delta'
MEDKALIERLTRLSGGSVGQALALADPALWEFRRGLLDGIADPSIDTVAMARALIHFVEEAGKESAAQRGRAALVLGFLVDFFREALSLSMGNSPRLVEPEDARALDKIVGRTSPERLMTLLDRCLEADKQIDRRVQLVLVLEALLDDLGQKMK